MGYLVVFVVIVLVIGLLGVVSVRRIKTRNQDSGDATARARATGAAIGKEARARQWRNKSRDNGKNDNRSSLPGCGGAGGCGGGGE